MKLSMNPSNPPPPRFQILENRMDKGEVSSWFMSILTLETCKMENLFFFFKVLHIATNQYESILYELKSNCPN